MQYLDCGYCTYDINDACFEVENPTLMKLRYKKEIVEVCHVGT